MNDLVTSQAHHISVADFDAMFSAESSMGDLTANVELGGFPVISFRGGKWRVKSGGEEYLIADDEGDPVPSILVNFVKSSKYVSRTYYAEAYEEGDDEAPACMSANGIAPDPGVEDPQSDACATCEQNKWGSRITDSGTKAKACGSRRRIAVAPLFDLPEEAPRQLLLFTVPTTSLKDLQKFGRQMEVKGFPYQMAAVKLGLDTETSYPRPTFKPIRALTAEDKELVVGFINESGGMEKVAEMLESADAPAGDGTDEAAALEAKQQAEAEAAEAAAKKAATKKKAAPKKKRAAKKKAAAKKEPALKVVDDEPTGDDGTDAALDDIFAGMDLGD